MRRVCCYCGADLDGNPEPISGSEPITHGACRSCLEEVTAGLGVPMEQFIDSFELPIFVVDGGGRVVGANALAGAMVSKEVGEIRGRLGGEVFECIHAREPGGCGATVHCRACTIRTTVTRTYETGLPSVRIPAYQDLDSPDGPRTMRFHISTQKTGDIVLLRIDDAEPAVRR